MKTIYVSDLDGTLLDNNAQIAEETAQGLNSLIDRGVLFSLATARTAATVVPMTGAVKINLPVILMNGAAIYDIQSSRYIKIEEVPYSAVQQISRAAKQCGISGFVYTIDNDRLHAWYDKISTPAMREFYKERRTKYNKPFSQVKALDDILGKTAVYFSFLDTEERLSPLYEKIKDIEGIKIEYYKDIYDKERWYLELLSSNASKKSGTDFLRQYTHADRVIGFGDNLNDLPLFSACDECYAVENAHTELKKAANAVIGSNVQNGVVKFVAESLGMELN